MNRWNGSNLQRGRILAVAAAIALGAGCATVPPDRPGRVIVLKAWDEPIGDGGCKIGYDLIYPADLPEQIGRAHV